MIKVFSSDCQNREFYAMMGPFFASLEVAKELEQQVYNKPGTTWYVTVVRSEVLGFASVHDAGKHYFLDNLYVIPEWRQRGIAGEMLDSIVEAHADKPIKCVASNLYALELFERLGFVEVGKRGKYKNLIKH